VAQATEAQGDAGLPAHPWPRLGEGPAIDVFVDRDHAISPFDQQQMTASIAGRCAET